MNSREGGEPSPEPEGAQLEELFENEIARERTRRTRRFIVIGLLSFILIIGLYGMFLGILTQPVPVSDTIQPQFTPVPETLPTVVTPSPDMAQPTSPGQTPTKDVSGAINGKANPGFPYWPSGTIPYRFDSAHPCSIGRTNNFLRAFKIIEDRTDGLVSFAKSSEGALSISCHDTLGAMGASGWSSPRISPTGSISNATIDMYRLPPGTYECDSYPTLEMHELFHVLGFENTASPGNVMYSETAEGSPNPCGELDAGIVNCLKNIYSNGKKGQSCTGIPHK